MAAGGRWWLGRAAADPSRGGAFDVESVGPLALKGFSRPMAVYNVVAVLSRKLPWDLDVGIRARLTEGSPVTPLQGGIYDADAMTVGDRIRRAIGGEERLRIRYTARSTGETTERTVRPFNVHFYDGHEYLEAFCELRGADRVFAVGSIERVLEEAAEEE
mgnify:CR=1 FL=1